MQIPLLAEQRKYMHLQWLHIYSKVPFKSSVVSGWQKMHPDASVLQNL